MISTKNFRKFRIENVVTEIPTSLDYMQEVYYRHPDGKLTLYIGRYDGSAQIVDTQTTVQNNEPDKGLPPGGADGQLLVKQSSTDYSSNWGITIRTGTDIPSNELGSDGDIYLQYFEN